MNTSFMIVATFLALTATPAPKQAAPAQGASAYLTPVFRDGARYDNVFSRAIALQADGFDDSVRRVSGSASYRVRRGAGSTGRLQIDYRYDGLQQGSGHTGFRDGGAVACYEGKCHPNTDASGLAYNPLLWGPPPARLHVGQHWVVNIGVPWELGPPGRQVVTVVALDPADHSVTLKREGEGDGSYQGDKPTVRMLRQGKTQELKLHPGHSHWYGYTIFRRGIVVSDELMVERPVTLESASGRRIRGREREYILLDAMPVPGGDAAGGNAG